MISYDAYKIEREKYLQELENIPDNEVTIIVDLIKVDVSKPLPQTYTVVYSLDRTPFIRDNLKSLPPFKKINEAFKKLGWNVHLIFGISPSDKQNVSITARINKLKI